MAIWCGLFLWAGLLAVGLIVPFFFTPGLMVPQQSPPRYVPSAPLDLVQVIASLSLLAWIILLAISVTLFLRKKARSAKQQGLFIEQTLLVRRTNPIDS